jgi:hypothetical protein
VIATLLLLLAPAVHADTRAELHSCACDLLRDDCALLMPAPKGGVALKLGPETAALVARVTKAATTDPDWDNNSLFAFEFQKRLAAVTAGLAFENVPPAAARKALASCKDVRGKLGDATPPAVLRQALAPIYRNYADLWRHRVAPRWPGRPCAEGNGVLAGKLCLDGYTGEHFQDFPIDERVPAAFSDFSRRLTRRLAPHFTPVEAGLIGCTFLRLETGRGVRRLREGDLLSIGNVSNHSRSTACDIRFLVLRDAGGHELRFDLAPKGTGLFPFTTALKKRLLAHYPALSWDEARERVVRGGESVFYAALAREAEKKLGVSAPPAGSELTPDDWFALKIGAIAREALVDSGFVVFDPLLNPNHKNHFHVEVAELPRAKEARERALDKLLREVAGLN